jgi:hypothetical protein
MIQAVPLQKAALLCGCSINLMPIPTLKTSGAGQPAERAHAMHFDVYDSMKGTVMRTCCCTQSLGGSCLSVLRTW